MTCTRCGRENADGDRYCGRCGLELRATQAGPQSTEDMEPCYRHPKEMTRLHCGRCEKPICTKCAKMGPAGVRCPDCAKHNVAVRPAAVVHTVGYSFRNLFQRGNYWQIYILVIIIGAVFSMFRGCGTPAPVDPYPEDPRYDREIPIDRDAP